MLRLLGPSDPEGDGSLLVYDQEVPFGTSLLCQAFTFVCCFYVWTIVLHGRLPQPIHNTHLYPSTPTLLVGPLRWQGPC